MLAGAGVRELAPIAGPSAPYHHRCDRRGRGVRPRGTTHRRPRRHAGERIGGGDLAFGPVLLLVGLAAAVVFVALNRRVGMIVIVLVVTLDLAAFASSAPWHGESISPTDAHVFYDQSRPPSFGSPYRAAGGIDRWASDWYGFRSLSLLKDLFGINGYDPLLQKEWATTAGDWVYDGYPTRPDLWESGWTSDVLRVSTLVLNNGIVPTGPGWRRDSAVPGIDFTRWVRQPRVPEAYLVSMVHLAPLADIHTGSANRRPTSGRPRTWSAAHQSARARRAARPATSSRPTCSDRAES